MDEREFQEKLEVEQKARERVAIQTVITAKKTRITTTKQNTTASLKEPLIIDRPSFLSTREIKR